MTPLRGFSSKFSDLLGFELLEWQEGHALIRCRLASHHLNRARIPHGGVLMALLDEAGAAAGIYTPPGQPQRRSVTISLNCQFTGQAREGMLLARGQVVRSGGTLYFSQSEVRDGEGQLIAFGASTHRFIRSAPE
jgi:uncharacterized protein (TIGR00369 family)